MALRLVVGWHFLYEGVWKIDSDTGSTSHVTSWYPLQSSVAGLRDYFERAPAGFELTPALARIDAWNDGLVKTFKGRNMALDEPQKARLAELRDKVKLAAADAAAGRRPPGSVVNFDWIYLRDEVLQMKPAPSSERFSSLPFLQASAGPFRPLFRGLVADIDGVNRLTVTAAQAALDERYGVITGHYEFTADQASKLASVRDTLKGAIAATLDDPSLRARLADYKSLHQRVASDGSPGSIPFSRERLAADREKLDAIAGELLALVNEPLEELAMQAQALATPGQLGGGPLPRPPDPARWIDRIIEWGLIAIGLCLILGLFTGAAALAAAAQLATFYLASPPWPGLPAATLGGHYLYIDRNFIEMIAALLVAVSGTGRWAGLDAWLFRRRAAAATARTEETVGSLS